jgi:SNF2 family DNA or RNA helicase
LGRGDRRVKLAQGQREGVEFLKTHRRAILADEMGSGKTAQVLTAIKELGYTRVLVVAPKIVKSVWEAEVEKWMPDHFVTFVMEGTEKDRLESILAARTSKRPAILITNYEQLRFKGGKAEETLKAVRTNDWDAVIFDEAHYLKNRHTQRFKAASYILAGRFCTVYMMTGTPVINNPGDIWTLLNLCDKNKFPHFWPWVSKHAVLMPNPFSRVPKIVGVRDPLKTQEELREYLIRRPKTDFHDLPPRTVTEIMCELSAEQRKLYNEMKMFGIAGDVAAAGKLAQVTRLRQLCLAPQLLAGETPLKGVKLDIAEQLCEDAGDRPVVVFTNFVDVAKEIALRTGGVAVTGDMNFRLRDEALDAFRNGDYRVLAMTLSVGGVGINLSNASVAIFTDVSWSPAMNAQAADRLHRPGQHYSVTVYVLTAQNTIEERVMQLLQSKDKLFDATVPGVPTETIIKLLQG